MLRASRRRSGFRRLRVAHAARLELILRFVRILRADLTRPIALTGHTPTPQKPAALRKRDNHSRTKTTIVVTTYPFLSPIGIPKRQPSLVELLPSESDLSCVEKHPEQIAFGKTILRLRRAAKLTQEDLADATDLSKNYVGEVERGERNPSLLAILALAKGLNISPAKLFADLNQ